tara:strand:- start:794 stop:2713 length:1920 start_codon:yes stop_codon:yes gene_type:complete
MSNIKITLPDKSTKNVKKGTTALEIAESIGKRLANDSLVAKVDDVLTDLFVPINEDAKLQILTWKDKEGVEVFRHSTAHLLAQAVTELYPEAKPTIGPAIKEGFFYDFDSDPFSPEDIVKIEKRMHEIANKNYKVKRLDLTKAEAKKLFKNNKYKLEIIDEEAANGKITAYQQGKFVDLCRGPHIPNTGMLNAFKLTKVSGAYWRGDQKNKQLQRIYGISFQDKKELNEYIKLQEEAEKRDHRKLGKELELFSIHQEGPGFIFFHPNGMVILNELMAFARQLNRNYNYKEIQTPIVLHRSLWEQSGHWEHYKDNMYFLKVDDQPFAIKPMNCPGAILTYKEKLHSYRELPLKLAEYGLVHRHELSGVLSGLFRVRSFTQDDAHIFITPGQIEDEVKNIIEEIDDLYKIFGYTYHIELSTKPEKAMGAQDIWDLAEGALKQALKSKKLDYKINEGDGAFYGPKIDFHIKDCLGRTWQCATVQVDFFMPDKFDLNYIAEDNSKHKPVILHRVLFGSIERFFGILIEHFAGKFPLWLAPTQVRILTLTETNNDFANELRNTLIKQDIRAELDIRTESIGKKVREAQLSKIPIIAVIGDKEQKNNTISVRTLDGKVKYGIKIPNFIEIIKKIIHEKLLEYSFK